jgi:hypothetical protein
MASKTSSARPRIKRLELDQALRTTVRRSPHERTPPWLVMIGSEAGEVLAAVQIAMMARLSYTAIRDAVLTHPTMTEGLNALFGNVSPL